MPRHKLVTVSVDPDELAMFKRVAKRLDLPVAEMVRTVVAKLDEKKQKKLTKKQR